MVRLTCRPAAGILEYLGILAVVGLVGIAALKFLGPSAACPYSTVDNRMQGTPDQPCTAPFQEFELADTGPFAAVLDGPFQAQLRILGSKGDVEVSAQGLPPGLHMSAAGAITGQPTQLGSTTASVIAHDPKGHSVRTDMKFVVHSSVVWDTAGHLGALAVTEPGTLNLLVHGGAGNLTYALAPGSQLPSGLTLQAEGILSGTPLASEVPAGQVSRDASFSVEITDSTHHPQRSEPLSVTLVGPPVWPTDPVVLPVATAHERYEARIVANAFENKVTYAVQAGFLPIGISLDATTGILSGVPAWSVANPSGTSRVTISATGFGGLVATHAVVLPIRGTLHIPAAGHDQSFRMPGCLDALEHAGHACPLTVRMWGAGGGGSRAFPGGSGGYTEGRMDVPPNSMLTFVVGSGGVQGTAPMAYGGGGAHPGSGPSDRSGSGGGRSAIVFGTNDVLVAGGGGGSGMGPQPATGGAGGGLVGGPGADSETVPETDAAHGGSQVGGGQGGRATGSPGMAESGGSSSEGPDIGNGSGGGGYFGGGSGSIHSSGAGGSGYVGGTKFIAVQDGKTFIGAAQEPPSQDSPEYLPGVGHGGMGDAGGMGDIFITWGP